MVRFQEANKVSIACCSFILELLVGSVLSQLLNSKFPVNARPANAWATNNS